MHFLHKAAFAALVVVTNFQTLSAEAASVTPTRYTTDQTIITTVKQDVIIGKDAGGTTYSNTVSVPTGGAIQDGTVGGKQASGTVDTHGTSTFILDGGIVAGTITSHGQSSVNISDGTAKDSVISVNSSTVTITGGKVAGTLTTYDNSIANIYDGTIVMGVGSYNSSTVNIFGGTVKGPLVSNNHSVFNIYGGNFLSPFLAGDNSVFNVYGDNLKLKLVDGNYQITGRLEDGSRINTTILDATNSGDSFNLMATPEASPTAVMSFGVLGLVGMMFFARKRRNAA